MSGRHLPTLLDEYPWLEGLPPSVCWAWVMFRSYVAKHGRPAGVIKNVTTERWAKRLNAAPGDYQAMVAEAMRVAAIRLRPEGRLYVPALAEIERLGESTRRMRKHRAQKRGDTPGADGLPCFTRKDALEVADQLDARGRRQRAFVEACVKALNLMVGKIEDPKKLLMDEAAALKQGNPQPWAFGLHPVQWLNQTVARALELPDGIDLLAPISE